VRSTSIKSDNVEIRVMEESLNERFLDAFAVLEEAGYESIEEINPPEKEESAHIDGGGGYLAEGNALSAPSFDHAYEIYRRSLRRESTSE